MPTMSIMQKCDIVSKNDTRMPHVRMFSMATILARNFIAPFKQVWFLLLIARCRQYVIASNRTRRNGIATCAVCNN
jgi:hypothetical protein